MTQTPNPFAWRPTDLEAIRRALTIPVTAPITGGLVQISNHHESRVIRKAEVETYLCMGQPW